MPLHRAPRRAPVVLAVAWTCVLASATLAAQPLSPTGPAGAPSPVGYGQQSWTISDGLPQGSILDIAQTPDGYIWLATYGGLVRFDGLRFTLFDAPSLPSLASNQVPAIAPAGEGGLWVAALGANVFRVEGAREVQQLPPHPAGRNIRRLALAPDGTLWAAADDLVMHFTGSGWTSFPLPASRIRPLSALSVDRAGTVWAGAGGGLIHIDGTRVSAVDVDGVGQRDFVAAIFVDHQDRLWAGSSAGLFRSDPSRSEYTKVDGIDGPVTSIRPAPRSDDVWVAAQSGLYVFPRGSEAGPAVARRIVSTEALGGSPVVELQVTDAGAIVGGTLDAGFRVFTPRPFELFDLAPGLTDQRTHHVVPDGVGGAWVGVGCAGLARLPHRRTTEIERFVPPQLGLRQMCVRGLLRDRRGNLWVGQAYGNLTRIGADGSTRAWTRADGLPDGDIGPLLEGRDGRIWVGSPSGVLCVIALDGRVSRPALPVGDATQVIWSLAEDEHGGIWLGQVGR